LDLEDQTPSVLADINDGEALGAALSAQQPEIIFHLAAQSLVRRSYVAPEETFATNVVGVVTLLARVARTPSVRAVVIATSDKCYEVTGLDRGFREDDQLGGRDPYSASKGCAEIAAASMRRSFFAPHAVGGSTARIATVRAGNVIGGGDWSADRLVPDIVRGCLGPDHRVVIRAPRSIRPWQHVLEPLRGYMAAAERLCAEDGEAYARGWNFGPNPEDERPVGEVVEAVRDALGVGEIVIAEDPTAPHETGILRLETTAAREQLGWRPVLDFEAAIAMTTAWYSGWARGDDAAKLTTKQIESYMDQMSAAA
jgi:CDP-glucose 4,6-dehydratase